MKYYLGVTDHYSYSFLTQGVNRVYSLLLVPIKKLLSLLLFLTIIYGSASYAQQAKSSTRKFIETTQTTRTNKDWNVVAEFKSGHNEHVRFFPIEIIDLKTNKKTKALELNMYILGMTKKKVLRGACKCLGWLR